MPLQHIDEGGIAIVFEEKLGVTKPAAAGFLKSWH